MNISDNGLNIIKKFEGYGKLLPDGSCTAYQDDLGGGKVDIPTIGWGSTEGVKMGDVWTVAQAEEGLRKEIAKFEAGVSSAIKFVPTQNQFDAMVSLAYNIGIAGFAGSTVLRKANAGDFQGASQAFNLWNRAQGQVLQGLVSRRAQEAALFLLDGPVSAPAPAVDTPPSVLSQLSISPTFISSILTMIAGLSVAANTALTAVPVADVQIAAGFIPYISMFVPQLSTVLGLVTTALGGYIAWRKAKTV